METGHEKGKSNWGNKCKDQARKGKNKSAKLQAWKEPRRGRTCKCTSNKTQEKSRVGPPAQKGQGGGGRPNSFLVRAPLSLPVVTSQARRAQGRGRAMNAIEDAAIVSCTASVAKAGDVRAPTRRARFLRCVLLLLSEGASTEPQGHPTSSQNQAVQKGISVGIRKDNKDTPNNMTSSDRQLKTNAKDISQRHPPKTFVKTLSTKKNISKHTRITKHKPKTFPKTFPSILPDRQRHL